MIKTYLKHFILDKSINTVIDGFIDTFDKPINFYTNADFYIGQHITTISTGCFTYTLLLGYVKEITDTYICISIIQMKVTDRNGGYINTHNHPTLSLRFNTIKEFT